MPNITQTGYIKLDALGEEAFIIKKSGLKIKIPSVSEVKRTISEAQKTKNYTAITEFTKNFPKIDEGDTIKTGKDTFVCINNSYNLLKDKPISDPQHSASKTINLFPESEIIISGYEKWSREEKETDTTFSGEMVKTFNVIKGLFSCSYFNCEDPLLTPVAEIVFKNAGGGGLFDLQDGDLHSQPSKSENLLLGSKSKGEVIFICLSNKKTYTAKSNSLEEIIVTKDSIYKIPFTKIDGFFNFNNTLNSISISSIMAMESVPETTPGAQSYASVGASMSQSMNNLEMMGKMSPDDLERLSKMSGTPVTEEQSKQIREFPNMIQKIKKEGLMDKINEAGEMAKAFNDGLGTAGQERMINLQKKGAKMTADYNDKTIQNLLNMAKLPRNYAPLNAEFKVA